MKKNTTLALLAVSMLVSVLTASAQQTDSTHKKLFRPNNIKINLTSFALYRPNLLISYERVLAPHKTFSVEAGYVQLPKLVESIGSDFNIQDEGQKSGFKIDADFRFYFRKENKYEAPHGLYWGPYAAYYYFHNQRTLTALDTTIATGSLELTSTIQTPQLGLELGYQFSVLKDHMTIDMLLGGPALALYKAKLSLSGNFDPNEENEYLNDLLNLLIQNFPLIGNLVSNKEVDTKGVADLFSVGFRYSVSVGYRF